MNIHTKKRAMTLVEVMVCTVILSLMIGFLVAFSNQISVSIKNNNARSEKIMKEYQDILDIRSAEQTSLSLNNQDYFIMIEENGQWQLWKYNGIFFDFIKLFKGGVGG